LLIQVFKQAGRVCENALIAFQGLCIGAGEHIDISEIGIYLKYALESNEEGCAKLACGIISDLAGSMGERLNEYLGDFVPCLHDILRNSEIDRRMKLPALQALGDLSMHSGDQFNQRFLNDTLIILNAAASMSVQPGPVPQNDQETLEFLDELREALIEQYASILLATSESDDPQQKSLFQLHLVAICDFLEATLKIKGLGSESTLRCIAGLMMDMSQQYRMDPQLKIKL